MNEVYVMSMLRASSDCIYGITCYSCCMRPYSQDLRERIIAALEANEQTQPEIAERFGVSVSTVEKLWKRWRSTGLCAALPHAGGRRRVLQDVAERIRAEVMRQRDATLSELCERVEQAGGVASSPSMMCRELHRLDLPRKKSRSTIANGIRSGSKR